jgi:hypothetical protein
MKALINPNEIVETGYRVCEKHETGFDVCNPLFWLDCNDTIIADQFWFDPTDNSFKEIIRPITLSPATIEQPATEGTQTL